MILFCLPCGQVPGVTDVGLKPRHVKKAAIIGGGLMGSGIATALILNDIYVLVKEINPEYLAKGIKMIEGNSSFTRKASFEELMLIYFIISCQKSERKKRFKYFFIRKTYGKKN